MFNAMVRRAMGKMYTLRYRAGSVNIPAAASTRYNLIVADDDPDRDVDGVPGTTACEVQPGAKIVKIDLKFVFTHAATGNSAWLEVALHRNEDNLALSGIDSLWVMDKTSASLDARKNMLTYGGMVFSTQLDQKLVRLRIRRRALRRAGTLSDLDRLDLLIKNNHATSVGTFNCWGTITVRED